MDPAVIYMTARSTMTSTIGKAALMRHVNSRGTVYKQCSLWIYCDAANAEKGHLGDPSTWKRGLTLLALAGGAVLILLQKCSQVELAGHGRGTPGPGR